MQSIDTYAKDDHMRVILQGPPGSGKSCLAAHFPSPYFIDLDVNLGGVLRHLRRNNLPLPVGYDVVDRDESGKNIPFPQRYARLERLLTEAQSNPAIETIVIDSATNLSSILVEETLRKQNKPSMSKQEWGHFFNYGKFLMSMLTQMRKHIVLTAHEKFLTNEAGAVLYPVQLAWPGQLGKIIGAFFTDVWRCEVKSTASGLTNKYSWLVRTMPDYRYELKNSLGLPPEFEFNWNTIATQLSK